MSAPTTGTTQLDSVWWVGGLSLADRVAGSPAAEGGDDDVHEHVDTWRLSCGEAAAGEFADRLRIRGLTEEGFAAVLAEPARAIAGRIARPDWAAFVATALARASRFPGGETGTDGWSDAFARVFAAFVGTAGDDLLARLGHLDLRSSVDIPALTEGFARRLGHQLATLASRTLVAELHRAGKGGVIRGADSSARFQDFVRRAAQPGELDRLMTTYPVLARLLATTSQHASETWAELICRYVGDRSALVTGLLDGGDPGRLLAVEFGAGDAHCRGRSTALLRFEAGATVVYKPRSLDTHLRLTSLMEWLNSVVVGLDLRPVAALARAGYGWLGFVPHRPCRTMDDVDRFYHRQGALMALLYAIDATDIHQENLIACADQPVVVDTETLFHPDLHRPRSVVDPAAATLRASVLRLLLLPQARSLERGLVDLSGMGGEPGQEYIITEWAGAGTDHMHLNRIPSVLPSAKNRPWLDTVEVDPVDHERAFTAGFRASYQAIVAHKAAAGQLLSDGADDEVRVVVQPTALYATLLTEATHPDALRDGFDHDQVFELLCDASLADPSRRNLVPHELADLWAGDVPLFTGRPGSRDLFTSCGQRLPGALATPGLIAARAKVDAMGATDRARQEWVISASFAARRARLRMAPDPAPLPATSAHFNPDHCVDAARAIADEVVRAAIGEGDAVNWLGFDLVDGLGWVVSPMGAGLSDGYCGVAVFLAQLADIVDEPPYAELAWRAVAQLPNLLAGIEGRPDLIDAVGCGGFDGFGGIAYAAARLGTLLSRPVLHDLALAALQLVDSIQTSPESLSLITGPAGCLAAALAVGCETGADEATRVARAYADRLVDVVTTRESTVTAATPYRDLFDVGFSLTRAAAWLFEPRYAEAGRCALQMAEQSEPDDGRPPGWCEGVAGAMLALAAHEDQRSSLGRLASRLAQRHPRRDLSLCHGELGMVDALMVDGGGFPWRDQVAQIAVAADPAGRMCGTPEGVPTPGLLRGLSGIGYQLLRVARPDVVPSVLTLSPTPNLRPVRCSGASGPAAAPDIQ